MERGFQRAQLCFTLASVDDAGNISQRSESVCVDTTDKSAQMTEVVSGQGCVNLGCSTTLTSAGVAAVLPMLLLAWRRKRPNWNHDASPK